MADPSYLLSAQAVSSLKQISDYTLNQFGRRQQSGYLGALRKQMRFVAADPTRGRDRGAIKQGYMSIRSGKHVIFYRVRAGRTEIIDVLHQSMEPKLHL